ncbi:anti-sigma factor family protein [Actinomadura yumaensis]|uniref:anti-sigma factor family protein n=1 Tax=Actinomadura TaxID=1988 RepID=UPI001320F29B|nr:zf-HC2 domain-containing protein [Actinomadura sp. J1-007]MWK38763.1 hypothetical protein [Actinomadura sp. J1-007]
MSADLLHVDVAAYALGLLEVPDRRAFEAHLPSCPPCHEELAVLRGVAATLGGMAPIDGPADAPSPAPGPAVVSDLPRRRARGGGDAAGRGSSPRRPPRPFCWAARRARGSPWARTAARPRRRWRARSWRRSSGTGAAWPRPIPARASPERSPWRARAGEAASACA